MRSGGGVYVCLNGRSQQPLNGLGDRKVIDLLKENNDLTKCLDKFSCFCLPVFKDVRDVSVRSVELPLLNRAGYLLTGLSIQHPWCSSEVKQGKQILARLRLWDKRDTIMNSRFFKTLQCREVGWEPLSCLNGL